MNKTFCLNNKQTIDYNFILDVKKRNETKKFNENEMNQKQKSTFYLVIII